jgi:antirestriction protein ArdC
MKNSNSKQEAKFKQMAEGIIKLFESVSQDDFKSWNNINIGMPHNLESGKNYQGFNFIYLLSEMMCNDFTHPVFGTFNQITHKNGSVNKGAKGFPITHYNYIWKYKGKTVEYDYIKSLSQQQNKTVSEFISNNDDLSGKGYFKFFTVFHMSQTSLAGEFENYTPSPFSLDALDMEVGALLNNLKRDKGLNLVSKPSNRAYYSPAIDQVCVPDFSQFDEKEFYYAVIFHELSHWTGHPDRLNRQFGKSFASEEYAFEELVAELSSLFICSQFGIEKKTDRSAAAYLKNWLTIFKSDINYLIKASKESIKATHFILE